MAFIALKHEGAKRPRVGEICHASQRTYITSLYPCLEMRSSNLNHIEQTKKHGEQAESYSQYKYMQLSHLHCSKVLLYTYTSNVPPFQLRNGRVDQLKLLEDKFSVQNTDLRSTREPQASNLVPPRRIRSTYLLPNTPPNDCSFSPTHKTSNFHPQRNASKL